MSEPSASQPDISHLNTASAARVTWPPDLSDEIPRPETVIRNYRLIEQIGAGGMGIVYKAEQLHPIRRTVALKLVKLGMDTREVVARFASERQALAMLEHPGIARVYDAGATDAGRPYFVMEYVPGQLITDYCDARRLTLRQRLGLFEQVCHAVQHAHYKGILHRDLKPSNILVTEIDGQPQPKVIDFGVAKAMQEPGAASLVTREGQLVGTPVYMSPEQAAGDDLDTRSDVYALGCVLYELLTGVLPFESEDSAAQRVTDPLRPSHRFSTLGARSTTVAAARNVDLRALQKSLRGELDLIVMKAIDRDRARRYDTAAALADDVRRHLAHEPIAARPPTLAYQARKFVRRRRILVGASLVVSVAILAGGVLATVGLVRARRALAREALARQAEASQRAEAQSSGQAADQVSRFLADMLRSVDPEQAGGKPILVRDVLDRAAADLGARFNDQPIVKASLHAIVAKTYFSLAMFEPARAHAQAALELRRRTRGPTHLDTLEAMNILAESLAALGKRAEAETLHRDFLAATRATLGPDDPTTLIAEDDLAMFLLATDRPAEAEPLERHALETRRQRLGELDRATLLSMSNLAVIAKSLNRLDEAESLLRRATAGEERAFGRDYTGTITAMNNLASVLWTRDKLAEAEPIQREVLARSERVYGEDHIETQRSLNNLAVTLNDLGKADDAEAMLRKAVERRKRSMPPNHPETLGAMANLAWALQGRGKLDDAASLLAEVYTGAKSAEVQPIRRARYAAALGLCLVKANRLAEAEAPLLEAKREFEAAGLTADRRMREVLDALAKVCDASGRAGDATAYRARAAAAAAAAATQPAKGKP
jgi:non-specific serine/threonine protein kinase/serine/threonine-protein kinase